MRGFFLMDPDIDVLLSDGEEEGYEYYKTHKECPETPPSWDYETQVHILEDLIQYQVDCFLNLPLFAGCDRQIVEDFVTKGHIPANTLPGMIPTEPANIWGPLRGQLDPTPVREVFPDPEEKELAEKKAQKANQVATQKKERLTQRQQKASKCVPQARTGGRKSHR